MRQSHMPPFTDKELSDRTKSDPKLWEVWARTYYSLSYTLQEKTAEEVEYMNALCATLKKGAPIEWENKIVELNFNGYFGEECWHSDGYVVHTLHIFHKKCLTPSLINRKRKLWCMKCNEFTSRRKTVFHRSIK